MRSKGRLLAIVPLMLTVGLVGPPAQAAPGGAGDCPAPFEAFTFAGLVQHGLDNGFSEAESIAVAESIFADINKNEDPFVCMQVNVNAGLVNFIDNNAR